jgi:hypothetical protein
MRYRYALRGLVVAAGEHQAQRQKRKHFHWFCGLPLVKGGCFGGPEEALSGCASVQAVTHASMRPSSVCQHRTAAGIGPCAGPLRSKAHLMWKRASGGTPSQEAGHFRSTHAHVDGNSGLFRYAITIACGPTLPLTKRDI